MVVALYATPPPRAGIVLTFLLENFGRNGRAMMIGLEKRQPTCIFPRNGQAAAMGMQMIRMRMIAMQIILRNESCDCEEWALFCTRIPRSQHKALHGIYACMLVCMYTLRIDTGETRTQIPSIDVSLTET